jgi:hypothetical protein
MPRGAIESSNTSRYPSDSIWGDCTVWKTRNPQDGLLYFDHFIYPLDPTTACGYTITQETSGTIDVLDGGWGILRVSSNGNAAAHDGINVQLGSSAGGEDWLIDPTSLTAKLWFEARVTLNDESDEFFLGLCDREADIIEQTTGMLDTTARSLVGFYTDAGTTATYLEWAVAKAGTADQDTDVGDGATVADATAINLGFKAYRRNGTFVVMPYVNGDAQIGHEVSAAANIPTTAMAISYVAQIAATGANAIMDVDWVGVAMTA